MTKTVSTAMAVIVMLTANVATPITYAATPQTITASVKVKSTSHKNKKHKHITPKGNMGKWFKSIKALKKYANKVMKNYFRMYENGEITWEEYVKAALLSMVAGRCTFEKLTVSIHTLFRNGCPIIMNKDWQLTHLYVCQIPRRF